VTLLSPAIAPALPTMIRLGYIDCAACHISAQGGGPLNEYGRGIDESQSRRAGEYKPTERPLLLALSFRGRITQDFRAVVREQAAWILNGSSPVTQLRPRLMYRNVTRIGKGLRVAATITGEPDSMPRPSMKYDPAAQSSPVFVNTALVHYRAGNAFEIAAGRDQLPTGVNVPDPGAMFKARNRLGYYDTPTQLKVFVSGKRYQITPFLYAPGGNERAGEAESGGGALAEVDLLGNQKTVTGITLRRGAAANGTRNTIGAYARLGFGQWGILAEHDLTQRDRMLPATADFRQQATFGQVFWAAREWLVASAIGERLHVNGPFAERLAAGRVEVAARLASQMTIVAGGKVQRNLITGRQSKSILLQLAFKTVN
jgi:hypothetical protein